jgi:intergrase/recombinase
MLALSDNRRLDALKAMVCLSKYLGCYEAYKNKLKNFGIKWANPDTAFNGFLAIFNHKHDTLSLWIREVQPLLYDNERLFLRFLAVTGLRKSEAITSFNMIIELNAKGKLGEYYNEDFSTLEHFKFGRLFLRGTKNAFISIVPKALIIEVYNSQPVTYDAIHCRLMRRHIHLRLKEFRSYHNSYLRKNGIITELVDVLAGRVPKSVFCRHYLGMNMKSFSNHVLSITAKLEESLTL